MSVLPVTSREVRTILLVDDQKFVGMALAHLLAGEAHLALHSCLDAEDAVTRANELAPGLILQDLVMPKLDGLTLVRMFRDNPATAGTPIVVLSANDDAETRARALAAGASGYLVKLPPKAELLACLRGHLAGHPFAAGTPRTQPAANDQTLDRGVIAALQDASLDGASGFVPNLIDQFIVEVTAQAAALGDASRCNDFASLAATAHRLKGGAATMGARRLAALCGRLEQDLARPGRPIVARVLVVAITEEVSRVRDACTCERERFEAHS